MKSTTSRSDRTSYDRTDYYYVQGRRLALRIDPEMFAVGFAGNERLDSDQLSRAARRALTEDSQEIGFVPGYNIRLYRSLESSGTDEAVYGTASAGYDRKGAVSRTLDLLADQPAIAFATPVVRRTESEQHTSLLTRNFLVAFKANVTAAQTTQIIDELGGAIIERLRYVANG